MNSLLKNAIVLSFYFVSTTAGYAQACKEPNASGAQCDHTQRDIIVTCDDSANPGTRPSCPKKPMPMIHTPRKSLIGSYSPHLFAYPRDKDDRSKAYNGPFGVGTAGGPDKVFNVFGNSAGVAKSIAACVDQIGVKVNGQPNPNWVPSNPKEEARLVRMKLDNCANQYILRSALYPYQKSRSKLINNPEISAEPVSLLTECQPLKTFMEMENEYDAREYLQIAWRKTLQDPNYTRGKPLVQIPAAISAVVSLMGGAGSAAFIDSPEPRMPKGITLSNYVNPPTPFPDVRISQIAAVPYEEIIDPTHPFSPRWDYAFTERQAYSPFTKTYMTNDASKNAVYCAGVRKANGQDDKDKEVPVDVLRFRKNAFEDGIFRRIGYNVLCYNDNTGEQDGYFWTQIFMPMNYCVRLNLVAVVVCAASYGMLMCDETGTRKDCWDCFKLDGKVDDEEQHPPCTTHHGGEDQKMRGFPHFSGAWNSFRRTATCNIPPFMGPKGKYDIDTLCGDLRRPYTSLNKLKMRYHNPDDSDNSVLKDGVQEGLWFKDYFTNHMPYPRLWDTGNSIQQNPSYDSNYQDPMDTKGQYTAIVGVGREDAPKSAGDDAADKHKDERCLLGGWGGTCAAGVCTSEYARTGLQQMFSGVSQIKLPDPITSWTELKMYQMRTMRYANMSCLGRYEKVFKAGSSENLALMALGGEWSRVIVQKCKRDNSAPCEYMSLKEYRDAGSPTSNTEYYTIPQTKLEGWPLAWRGYMVDNTYKIPATESPIPLGSNQFPNFGSAGGVLSGALLKTGMGSAQLGDIVLMPSGASNGNSATRGLAKIAIVSEVNLPKASKKPGEKDCVDRNDCYVQVLEADNGKFPDVCGTTSAFGEVKARYLYAPGKLPTSAKEEFQRINAHTMSCEDTNLGRCEFLPWNSVRLYRIREDTYPLRTGCDQENAKDCQ